MQAPSILGYDTKEQTEQAAVESGLKIEHCDIRQDERGRWKVYASEAYFEAMVQDAEQAA